MPFNIFIQPVPGPDGNNIFSIVNLVGDAQELEAIGSALFNLARKDQPLAYVDLKASNGMACRIVMSRVGDPAKPREGN